DGTVDVPVLGRIKLSGLTTSEARDAVKLTAKNFFANPTIDVRFANFRITVIGEVSKPASYIIPNEQVSVLDAIGYAGDLTIYGKRENVLIVRDQDGKKEFARLNLNSSDIFNSPFYYLKQNDVVYVEPNKAKASANNAPQLQTIGIITSVLSVLVLAISVLK
ncbi:MAG: hypothetical protein EOO43_25070, partial [Flavobacterium sp.]